MRRSKRTSFALAAATVVALSGAVVATGAQNSGREEAPDRSPTAEQVTDSNYRVERAQAISAEQRRSFPILRRDQRASDRILGETREMLSGGRLSGSNVDLARAIDTPTGKGWVIPGSGHVCVAIPDPVDGFGVNCNTVANVRAGYLLPTMSGGPDQEPGEAVLVGLLPDDATGVSVTSMDGTTEPLKHEEGVVAATLQDPKSVNFSTSTGAHTIRIGPVPEPPAPDEKPSRGSLSRDCGDGRVVAIETPNEIATACD